MTSTAPSLRKLNSPLISFEQQPKSKPCQLPMISSDRLGLMVFVSFSLSRRGPSEPMSQQAPNARTTVGLNLRIIEFPPRARHQKKRAVPTDMRSFGL